MDVVYDVLYLNLIGATMSLISIQFFNLVFLGCAVLVEILIIEVIHDML